MRKINLALFMPILIFVGCRGETPSGNNNGYTIQDYFPLKVGNIWVYQGEHDWGFESDIPRHTISIETLRVVSGNDTNFVLEHTSRDSFIYPSQSAGQVYNLIDTFYYQILFINDFPYEPELHYYSSVTGYCGSEGGTLMKEPLVKGNSWDNYKIDDIDFEYNVPAGTFDNCLRISSNWSDSIHPGTGEKGSYVFAFGVGKIEDSYHEKSPGGSSAYYSNRKLQLISYKLK